jgi:hypothetical protein
MCNGNGTKLGLKLDWFFKFCVQMAKIKGLKNPKSNVLKSNQRFHQKQKKIITRIKVKSSIEQH